LKEKNKIKGIILAGGYGSRLYPLTWGVSKHLLPVYDKPMIYYPLSVLMEAGINEILIISKIDDLHNYQNLFKNGSHLGLKISYKIQQKPNGIAESFTIASDFIGNDNVCLILGDNIFHGKFIIDKISLAKKNLAKNYSSIFGVEVNNPKDFGVIEYDNSGRILNIIEKPSFPKSKMIVSGLYFYNNEVVNFSKKLKPSSRGELEITDINNIFLSKGKLKLIKLNNKTSWIDTGTFSSLIKASKYFEDYELLTNKKVACIEELAFKMGYIDKKKLIKIASEMKNSDYGKYLFNLVNN